MTDGPLLRLLDMVQRELGADDARVELGGKDPSDERLVWVRLSESRRVVAVFENGPSDREQATQRLLALVEAFAGTASPTPDGRQPPGALTRALLSEQLGMLAERVDALRVVVVDDTSPIVWGSSDPFYRSSDGVDAAIRTAIAAASAREAGLDFGSLLAAGLDGAGETLASVPIDEALRGALLREIAVLRAERSAGDEAGWRALVVAARAIAFLRHRPVLQAVQPRARRVVREEGFGLLAKPFASSYWLVCAFDRSFSELRVEGTVLRALPRIERLVLALPPMEPPPAQGRVLRLPKPK